MAISFSGGGESRDFSQGLMVDRYLLSDNFVLNAMLHRGAKGKQGLALPLRTQHLPSDVTCAHT